MKTVFFFLTLCLVLFLGAVVSGGSGDFFVDMQAEYQQDKLISKEDLPDQNIQYSDDTLQSVSAKKYGLNLRLFYLEPLRSLSSENKLLVGPFISLGIHKYIGLLDGFEVSRSFLIQAGYEAKLVFSSSSKSAFYLKGNLGFFYEWINWQFVYDVHPQLGVFNEYEEHRMGPLAALFAGMEYTLNPSTGLYVQAGFLAGNFTSRVNNTQAVSGSDHAWFYGFKINLGVVWKL